MPLDLREQLQRSVGPGYAIDHELESGTSRVFLADDVRLGRRVVLKVLNPELAAAVAEDRFEQEMGGATRLEDPHIVPILAAGDTGGLPYYIMPYVDGESVRARLERGKLSVNEAIAILRDVALALQHAHERGVVHGDIGPDHVRLIAGTAVVTDFGVANAIAIASGNAALTTLTHSGLSGRTPAYMAPEQAEGDVRADHRADIYAWGMMAYELLAGLHPFGGRTTPPHVMVAAQIGSIPPPLETHSNRVPARLSSLVDRCLSKDPAQRPSSAADLLRGIETSSSTMVS
jgi:serine/threonine-protein kinase